MCRKVEDGQGRSGLDYAEAADHTAIIALLNTGRIPCHSTQAEVPSEARRRLETLARSLDRELFGSRFRRLAERWGCVARAERCKAFLVAQQSPGKVK